MPRWASVVYDAVSSPRMREGSGWQSTGGCHAPPEPGARALYSLGQRVKGHFHENSMNLPKAGLICTLSSYVGPFIALFALLLNEN